MAARRPRPPRRLVAVAALVIAAVAIAGVLLLRGSGGEAAPDRPGRPGERPAAGRLEDPGDRSVRVHVARGGVPGLLAVHDTAPLALTRAFGRALLGGVGLTPGSETGQWGLEKVFDSGSRARRRGGS